MIETENRVLTLSEREELIQWRAEFLSAIAKGKPLDEIARRVYKWILELDAHNGAALNALGRLALRDKHYSAARRYFDAAARLAPEDYRILLNAAVACDASGDLDEAEAYAWKALEANPETASPYMMLVSIAERRDRPDLMGRAIHAGLKLDPENKELLFARAFLELKRGEYDKGWADYEYRSSRLDMLDKLDEVAEWRGESLEGKTILVAGEQGFGDQILFARYLRMLPKAKTVYVYARPELARLFEGYNVVTSDRELTKIEPDYWILMGSLPHLLGIDTPIRTPFLIQIPPGSGARFRQLIPETGNLRVGLAWKGNPDYYRESYRGLGSIEPLRPLLEVPGCDFYSLQYGDADSGLLNLSAYAQDWFDTAAAIRELDLVVTVDTGVANLAASLGAQTWILLSRMADWRWGLPEPWKNTAWYPSTTECFQQKRMNDWPEVIGRVKKALEYRAGRRPNAECQDTSARPAGVQGNSIIQKECRWHPKFSYLGNDKYIGRAMDLFGEWSESETALFRDLVRPGNIVIEAGANIGALTLPLAYLAGESGEVWAFEPVAETFELLASNTKHLSQVKIVHAGLSTAAGTAAYKDSSLDTLANPGGTELTAPERDGKIAEVAPLDWYALPRVDFMKIDVEGMELDVLQGAAETVARCQPIIYAENDRLGATERLCDWLIERGYRVYQHLAPLYNPDNYRGYKINVFGGLHSFMLLAMPRGRYLEQAVIDRHNLSRLRIQKRKN